MIEYCPIRSSAAVRTAVVIAATLVLATMSASANLTIAPTQDAPIRHNLDGQGSWDLSLGNWYNETSARFSPSDRVDRVPPGLIEETRTAMEFNLSALSSSASVSSAILQMNVDHMAYVTSVNILAIGYAGNGEITTADFAPSVLMNLPSFTLSVANPVIQIDVTSFINGLLATHQTWAGINLQVDYSSLPARGTLSTDTTMGGGIWSFESGRGPQLLISAVPEPSTCFAGIGALGLLALTFLRGRK
jgi:hypothetical protein